MTRIFILIGYSSRRERNLSHVMGVAAILLTIFGIYSWNDVVRKVQAQLEEKGTENVIEDVTTRFISEHRGAIEEAVLASLEDMRWLSARDYPTKRQMR